MSEINNDVILKFNNTGSTRYPITFEYDRQEQIRVRTYNTTTLQYDYIADTDYEFDGPTTLVFTGVVPDNFEIVRETDISKSYGTSKFSQFAPVSAIKSDDLNGNLELLRLRIEEITLPDTPLYRVDLDAAADDTNVTVTNTGGDDAVLPAASSTTAGVMTKDAYNLLSDLSTNSTNLSTTQTATEVTINNSTGTDAVIDPVSATQAGVMTPSQLAKTGVSKIVAGELISITKPDGSTTDGTGEVKITSDISALSFEGNVDVTSDNIPSDARNAQKQDLYLNTGDGKFSAAWAAVTDDATTDTEALPGDYMVYNGSTWNHIPTGQVAVWTKNSGNIYPTTITDNVGIGTKSPGALLTIKGEYDLDNIEKLTNSTAFHIYDISNLQDTRNPDFIAQISTYGRSPNVLDVDGNTLAGSKGGLLVQAGYNKNIDIARFSSIGSGFAEVPRLVIKDTGNVGIGTDSPAVNLEVSSETLPRFSLTESTEGSRCELMNNAGKLSIRADEDQKYSSSYIDIRVSADEKMRIKSDGNVGIGTTSPAAKLTVHGTQNADPSASKVPIGDIYIQNVGGTEGQNKYGGSISFSRINTTRRGAMIAEVQPSSNNAQAGLAFFTKGSTSVTNDAVIEQVRIDHNGNVGIGTTNPAKDLHIANTGTTTLRIQDLSNSSHYSQLFHLGANTYIENRADDSAGDIYFRMFDGSSQSTKMTIKGDGNVGIGTTSPSVKLDVNGNIKASGTISPNAFMVRMDSDNPAAYQTTYSTDEEGNSVETQIYNGTTEDLLSIIKDLRARITALEADHATLMSNNSNY